MNELGEPGNEKSQEAPEKSPRCQQKGGKLERLPPENQIGLVYELL